MGPSWSYELKWDGFRAIVSTEEGLRVHKSPRLEHDVLPELRSLPHSLVLDGELGLDFAIRTERRPFIYTRRIRLASAAVIRPRGLKSRDPHSVDAPYRFQAGSLGISFPK